MRLMIGRIVVGLFLLFGVGSTASADPVMLTYTGNVFQDFFFEGSLPPDVYTTTDRVTGIITLAAPLGANLVGGFVTPLSFSFSDGVNTITNTDPALAPTTTFQFWTDASGQIVNWALNLADLVPGDFFRTIQTINMSNVLVPPGIPCGASCETDEGTSTLCGPVANCLDASGIHIHPLYSQLARVDGRPGTWTTLSRPLFTSLTAAPNVLWPPNHRLISVSLNATATGVPSPTCQISSVSSNEGSNAPGTYEWAVTGPLSLDLLAERAGSGKGRVYTITVTCTNIVGNAAQAVIVSVPHDLGR